jgi:hypothetical protein
MLSLKFIGFLNLRWFPKKRSANRTPIPNSTLSIYPPQIPIIMLFMKVWVVVYNYGLINEDVGIFSILEDARRGFREYGECDVYKKGIEGWNPLGRSKGI